VIKALVKALIPTYPKKTGPLYIVEAAGGELLAAFDGGESIPARAKSNNLKSTSNRLLNFIKKAVLLSRKRKPAKPRSIALILAKETQLQPPQRKMSPLGRLIMASIVHEINNPVSFYLRQLEPHAEIYTKDRA
jgi:hypothetical protein